MAGETQVEVAGETVRLSSPDRVLFPERGWTKLDLARYLAAVAVPAFRGVADRPVILKRFMGTVADDPVYQRQAGKNPLLDTVEVHTPWRQAGRMNVPRKPADIVRMAQLGCIDFHPLASRAEDLDHPDEMRFDLDPSPGSGFAEVRQAAGALRELLEEAGLVGWPKTSGSRGIHVYVRIQRRWDAIEVRSAVLAAARELERRHPDLVTTSWWKEERRGVFVDYNQAAPDKSMSSAYGVRTTGFVSTPFKWDELDSIEIASFPMDRFVVDRFERVGDPWEGFDAAPGSIDALLDWSVRDRDERGLGDAPWPPHYPKQPDEPPRVQPSKRRNPPANPTT